jgi:predicted metal-binding membrane protein
VLSTGAAPVLWTVSLAGWGLVMWTSAAGLDPHGHGAAAGRALSFPSWLAMLAAMMAPLVVHPIDHLWARSFRAARWRRVALFAFAYALVWSTAGWLLVSASRYLAALVPETFAAAFAAALAIAWQTTPAKQICLNRCHALPAIRAFGPAADRDAFRFGLRSGCWCVGSCWGLMLVPMAVGGAHVVAMAAVTAVAVAERHTACRPSMWRLPRSLQSR